MFWKRTSEWAKLAPSSPSAVKFGVASAEGYKKLVLLPQDPASEEFLTEVDQISAAATKPEVSENRFEALVADLEGAVAKFSMVQRHSIETSLGAAHEGLRSILNTLESAIESSHNLEAQAEQSSARLSRLQAAKSYEELVSGVQTEVIALNQAVKTHKDREKLIREVASKCANDLRGKLRVAEQAVKTDHLTQLGNRAAFEIYLANALAKVHEGEAYCLGVLDIDKFKEINDKYGHLAGDAALAEVAKRLKETFSLNGCSVVRLGGDEYAVLYKGNLVQLEAKLERVNSVLSKAAIRHESHTFSVHISFGVAALSRSHTQESAIQQADQAMYKAKRKVA